MPPCCDNVWSLHTNNVNCSGLDGEGDLAVVASLAQCLRLQFQCLQHAAAPSQSAAYGAAAGVAAAAALSAAAAGAELGGAGAACDHGAAAAAALRELHAFVEPSVLSCCTPWSVPSLPCLLQIAALP